MNEDLEKMQKDIQDRCETIGKLKERARIANAILDLSFGPETRNKIINVIYPAE